MLAEPAILNSNNRKYLYDRAFAAKLCLAPSELMAYPFAPEDELTILRSEYLNGRITMRELMESVDLGPDATLDDYREVFDNLLD